MYISKITDIFTTSFYIVEASVVSTNKKHLLGNLSSDQNYRVTLDFISWTLVEKEFDYRFRLP